MLHINDFYDINLSSQTIMEFLFEVTGLSVPLVQEIVWLSELKYTVLDCLKPPHYFIPKGSVPIENHAGHNLATKMSRSKINMTTL